jgi:hypothetical protein
VKPTNYRDRWLLSLRRERPCCRRATDKCDELAPSHWLTLKTEDHNPITFSKRSVVQKVCRQLAAMGPDSDIGRVRAAADQCHTPPLHAFS